MVLWEDDFIIAVGKSDRFVLSTTLLEDRSLGLAEREAHKIDVGFVLSTTLLEDWQSVRLTIEVGLVLSTTLLEDWSLGLAEREAHN